MRGLLELSKLAARSSVELKGIQASSIASCRSVGGIRGRPLSSSSLGLRQATGGDGESRRQQGGGKRAGSGAGKKGSLGAKGATMASGGQTKGGGKSVAGNCVIHDQASSRFTMDLGNKQVARIDYRLVHGAPSGKSASASKVIEMYHTEVPEELRGRGIGKALASGALEHVARNNMKVKLTCSYLIEYMDKFAEPKYRRLVSKY